MELSEIEKITKIVLETLSDKKASGTGSKVPVGVSARHIHLTQEDVETPYKEKRSYGRTICV